MKENNYLQLKDYFKNLVENSTFLNDFVGFFGRELGNRIASLTGLKSPALILYNYEFGLEGPNENTIAVRKISFWISFGDIKPDELEKQYIAIDNAEKLALKVLARIRMDSYKQDHFMYNSFLKDSVEITPAELDFNNFGVSVSFNIKNKQLLSVNKDDWKDVDQVCS